MIGILVTLTGLLGLAVGSFLNVVIWRVPNGQSVFKPRSSCPRCESRISSYDNVPVLSWVILRGRCRSCQAPISFRYPLIELGTGISFALTAWWLGGAWVVLPMLYMAAIAIALTAIDLEHHRLPDAIVIPTIAVISISFIAIAAESSAWGQLGRASLAGIIFLLAYIIMVVIYPAGMGLGDVKLAPTLGFVLGWWGWGAVLIGFFAAFLVGGLVSILLIAKGTHDRKSGVPFGPFMFIGMYIGLLWGNQLWNSYLDVLIG